MIDESVYNKLIAAFAVSANNVHGRHVNLTGSKFRSWHLEFQEIYEYLYDALDNVMELVVQRGGIPSHSFRVFLETSEIDDEVIVPDWDRAVATTRDELKYLIDYINKYAEMNVFDAAAANDLAAIASKLYHYYMFCEQTLK